MLTSNNMGSGLGATAGAGMGAPTAQINGQGLTDDTDDIVARVQARLEQSKQFLS